MKPTERTLKAFREMGFAVGIVERYINFTRQRIDLFGIIDIIAIRQGEIIGIQSCGQAFSSHLKKMNESEYTEKWLASGAGLQLWGWRKVKKKRGGKAMVYKPRVHCF